MTPCACCCIVAFCLSLKLHYANLQLESPVCRYLDKAVAVVLAFIGAKMIFDEVPGGFHINTSTSLIVVASCLGVGTAASLLIPAPAEGE